MRLLFLCCLFLLHTACSDSDKTADEVPVPLKADEYPQKWELVAMTGSIANEPPITGDNLPYKETILLHSDDSFTKIRKEDSLTVEISGGFLIEEKSDGRYLTLIYPQESALIGNCSNETKEWFRFDSDTQLIGTWWACDGPGLFFERLE